MATAVATGWRFRQPSVIPGFGITLGFTMIWLSLIVLIPLAGVFWRAADLSWAEFAAIASSPRVLNPLRVSFGTAFIAALVNVVFGVLVAWVLVRYRFPGRKIVDALVDLPFALPTAVAGVAFTALYAPNGWLGAPLQALGVQVAYTPLGIVVALVFIGLPFVVRTVQPVMEELEREMEEAAATLGASRLQTLAASCCRRCHPPSSPASGSPSPAASASTARSSSLPATSPTCRKSRRC